MRKFSSIENQPGEIVNEVFKEFLPSIVELCDESGDDPNILIEEVRHELRVKGKFFSRR